MYYIQTEFHLIYMDYNFIYWNNVEHLTHFRISHNTVDENPSLSQLET